MQQLNISFFHMDNMPKMKLLSYSEISKLVSTQENDNNYEQEQEEYSYSQCA